RDGLERHRTDEFGRGLRHHGDDVVAALLQSSSDFDRLVRADAAGDAERDQTHDSSVRGSGSSFSTAFVTTSSCALVVFLCLPTSTLGVEPASSWRARAPAVTTNS